MDRQVQRLFIGLILIFSISFVVLSVIFRSTKILGFPGDYWAGIMCVGDVFLIMGLVIILNFPVNLRVPKKSKVPLITYVSITLAAIGLIPIVMFLISGKVGEFYILRCPKRYYLTCELLTWVLPIPFGFIGLILGYFSLERSKEWKSSSGQYWSKVGLILSGICTFSPILYVVTQFDILILAPLISR